MGLPSAPSPTKISVDVIKSKLLSPALTSHYDVYITPPDQRDQAKSFILQSGFQDNMEDLLRLSCCEASLPGSQLATHTLNDDFTGVSQKHAYRKLYDDRADFTFYVNQNYDQIRYFEAWIRFISGEQINGAETTFNNYRAQYPKNYKSPSISITKFERNLGTKEKSRRISYTFINAFPISIASMPVSYDSSQLLKVMVSFAYDRYVAGNIVSNVSSENNSNLQSSSASALPYSSFELTPNQQALANESYSQRFNLAPNQFNFQSNIDSNAFGNYQQGGSGFFTNLG